MMKKFLVISISLGVLLSCISALASVKTFDQLMAGYGISLPEHQSGYRYTIPPTFDPDNEVYVQRLIYELTDYYKNGLTGLELQINIKPTADTAETWLKIMKIVYSTANELGMTVDLRIDGHPFGFDVGEAIAAYFSDPVRYSGGETFSQGTTFEVVPTLVNDMTSEDAFITVLAIRYTNKGNGEKVQQDVISFDADDFDLSTQDDVYTYTYNGEDVILGQKGDNFDVMLFYTTKKTVDRRFASFGIRAAEGFYDSGSAKIHVKNIDTYVDDELQEMMIANGGKMVCDGGDGATSVEYGDWSPQFQEVFYENFGYKIDDYMGIIYAGYELQDEKAASLVRADWRYNFNYLFEKYCDVINEFVAGYNTLYRVEAGYSTDSDTQLATQFISQPDVESLHSGNGVDNMIAITTVRNLTGGQTVGDELGALGPYNAVAWNDLLAVMNTAFSCGVNVMFYHTGELVYDDNTVWPGYAEWGYSMLTNWSMSSSLYGHVSIVADYMNNGQYILQSGTARRDIAVYLQSIDKQYDIGKGVNDILYQSGYSYDIVSPATLSLEAAQSAIDGVIDPNGTGYRAIVIGEILDGNSMNLDSANTLLTYANAGVPIIVVGKSNIPTEVISFSEYGKESELGKIFSAIADTGNMIIVNEWEDVPAVLAKESVLPDAYVDGTSELRSYEKILDDGTRMYFLYNYDEYVTHSTRGTVDNAAKFSYEGKAIDKVLHVKADGVPYLFDLWTGKISRVANYSVEDDGYISLSLDLAAGDACVLVIAPASEEQLHPIMPGKDLQFDFVNDVLSLQAFENDTYEILLSDGSTKTVTAEQVAKPISLDSWDLTVESWTPLNEFGTKGIEGTYTKKTKLKTVHLDELVAWKDIESIGETVSGVGTYVTTFSLDGNCDGAILSVGDTFDTIRVFINGNEVIVNEKALTADLSGHLVEGKNTLAIESVSELNNVLYMLKVSKTEPERYGIFGPVVITPYVNLAIQ